MLRPVRASRTSPVIGWARRRSSAISISRFSTGYRRSVPGADRRRAATLKLSMRRRRFGQFVRVQRPVPHAVLGTVTLIEQRQTAFDALERLDALALEPDEH